MKESAFLSLFLTLLVSLLAPLGGGSERAAPEPRVVEATVIMGENGALAYSPAHLKVKQGYRVQLTLINKDTAQAHALVIREQNAKSAQILPGKSGMLVFSVEKAGTFRYFCDVPGHKDAGMVGAITVEP